MRLIIFLVFLAWMFWIFMFRKIYISHKYFKPQSIQIPTGTSKEDVFQLLNTKLSYPNKREMHYDEEGRIVIVCKKYQYIIEYGENEIQVLRGAMAEGKEIEEAACIESYIRKIFDSNAPVNPYRQFQAMKNNKLYAMIITAVIVVVCILAIVQSGDANSIGSAISSKNISTSYLTQYSKTKTIGEAFDNFFVNGKWKSYNEGAKEYVDYVGDCSYENGDSAHVIIRFLISGEKFEIETIYVDGEEQGELSQLMLLQTIFE